MKFSLDNKITEIGELSNDYFFLKEITSNKSILSENDIKALSDKIEKRMLELLELEIEYPIKSLRRNKTILLKNKEFQVDINQPNQKRVLFLNYVYSLCLEALNSNKLIKIEH